MAKYFLLFIVCGLLGCDEKETIVKKNAMAQAPVSTPVAPFITEASGIADSKANPGFLWVHEDGGNPTKLYLLKHNGDTAKTVFLKGITNKDWEDISLTGNDIYIADIGDNISIRDTKTIYKFREPGAATDTIDIFESIDFKYADGAHDAEAFLVDPASRDIYIITKRDSPSRIYKITYPYSLSSVNTATLAGTLAYSGVVSAALSGDGKAIIIKTYTSLYYYTRKGNEPLEKVLQKAYTNLPYTIEPQGEAVTFAVNSKGYFTLSELAFSKEVNLNYYQLD